MLTLYSSIAIGGVLLAFAPPQEVAESKVLAHKVGFILTWPCYLIVDLWLERRRRQ